MCVYMFPHVQLHMGAHVCGHLKLFSTLFIKARPLTEPDITDSPILGRVARQLALESQSLLVLGVYVAPRLQGFDMDSKDLHSSP